MKGRKLMKQMNRAKLLTVILMMTFLLAFTVGCGNDSAGGQQDSGNAQNADADIQQDEEPVQSADSGKSAESDGLGDKLASTYIKMMEDEKYLMKYKSVMDIEGEQVEVEATIAVSGDDSALIVKGNGMETTTIMKADKTYIVDHQSKSVFVMPGQDAMEEEDAELDTEGITYIGNGTEDGLAYEEYKTLDGTLKYYFDGKNLVRIAAEIEGITTVMDILEMSNQVPASLFEIPAGYQEIGM